MVPKLNKANLPAGVFFMISLSVEPTAVKNNWEERKNFQNHQY